MCPRRAVPQTPHGRLPDVLDKPCNSFRIKFLGDPLPLTSIELYSCKKQRGAGGIMDTLLRSRPRISARLFSIVSTLFHFTYALSPLFATLAKTAGVWGHSSQSGTRPFSASTPNGKHACFALGLKPGAHVGFPLYFDATGFPVPSLRVWMASTFRFSKCSASPLGQRTWTHSILEADPRPKWTRMSLLEM